jgi:hypothetical protein
VTGGAGDCSFCSATRGPFATVEGLFTVLICIPCLEVRQAQSDTHLGLDDPCPYPAMTRAEMRASLELLPSWVLAQKAAANRQVIAVTRQRLAAGEQVAGCIRSRAWPGWSAKPRPPSSCSPSGRPTTKTDDEGANEEAEGNRPPSTVQVRAPGRSGR